MDTKYDDVTIIMPTFNNLDFTKASTFSIRQFYPDIKIIYADGGSDDGTIDWAKYPNTASCNRRQWLVHCHKACYEDVLNAAAGMVETEYMLIVNNTVKFTHPGRQIEILKEPFEKDIFPPTIMQTGAYCVKVTDWEKREAFVSKVFDKSIEVDACSGYLTMHHTLDFREIGGQPKEHFYPNTPKKFTHWSSDLAIGNKYRKRSKWVMCPEEPVPHLHWVQASSHFKKNEFRDWWYKNTKHTRQEPLR